MINFSNYISISNIVDNYDSDKTVLSYDGLTRLVNTLEEYAFIVPKNLTDKNYFYEIRSYFYKNKHLLYPIACKENKNFGKIFLVSKKINESSTDFKNLLSDGYYSLKNYNILYKNNKEIKILQNNIATTFQEDIGITTIQQKIFKINKNLKLIGVEVPLNEDTKSIYKSNNLITLPLLNEEFKYAKNWKTI